MEEKNIRPRIRELLSIISLKAIFNSLKDLMEIFFIRCFFFGLNFIKKTQFGFLNQLSSTRLFPNITIMYDEVTSEVD